MCLNTSIQTFVQKKRNTLDVDVEQHWLNSIRVIDSRLPTLTFSLIPSWNSLNNLKNLSGQPSLDSTARNNSHLTVSKVFDK